MSAPTRDELIAAARTLWGPENRQHSSKHELRFGTNGSKSLDLRKLTFYDFETGSGGGYVDLLKLAEHPPPRVERRHNGNGQDARKPSRIVQPYDYRDESGTLLFQVVRLDPKSFLQRRPDPGGKDGWTWNLNGVRRVLYRLPELLAADPAEPVFICEGEKDVDNLRATGLVATCNPGGAAEHRDTSKPYKGKWRPEYDRHLRGRDVAILQDNDAAGRAHARHVLASLKPVARSACVVELPGLRDKGDVSDWIAAGGTAEVLIRIAHETPEVPPASGISEPPTPEAAGPDRARRRRNTVNMLALVAHIKNTEAWNGVLRFNELTETYELCPPFPPRNGAKEPPRPVHDPHDILLATLYFQANGFPTVGKIAAWDALAAVAHEHGYHPIRDYLGGLRWDHTARVGTLFQCYFNAALPDDPAERDRQVAYLEHISVGFMVGAVARAMQPGCKVDHLPVVVGRQRLLKSTAVRSLCHDPAWFTDNISPNLIDRDTKESLRGKWIIELAEIPHIRRESERVKAFFSSQEDRYRSAYGRLSQDHPRQCVFIGTSNDLEFVDVTGNSRYWPFRVAGPANVAAIVADRDQLWAEATALYRQGVQWWLAPTIEAIAEEQQAAFAETDVWDELIAAWAERHPGPFTMQDLFARETGITPYRDTAETKRADEMRAANCLKRLGFTRSQKTIAGRGRSRWWERG